MSIFLVPPILGNDRTIVGAVQNLVTPCRCRVFPKEQMLSVVLGTKETILSGGFVVQMGVCVASKTKDINICDFARGSHITHFFQYLHCS